MSQSNQTVINWSTWHDRLHKILKEKEELIPNGASVLIAVSGGQDSMALLQLMIDLKRLHHWDLKVWHGDHSWHNKSNTIANELKGWCKKKKIGFHSARAIQKEINNEKKAREWRYKQLALYAKSLICEDDESKYRYVLTGHTATDKAETFLINLARGTDLAGLSSLKESRFLDEGIQLVRPLLVFSRNETAKICQDLDLPIWIDPSNENLNLTRNKVRKKIIPVLEDIYKGASIRITALSERLNHYKTDQQEIGELALCQISKEGKNKICRKSLIQLSPSARRTLLAVWLKQAKIPALSSKQISHIGVKVGKRKPPGRINLRDNWIISWTKDFVLIAQDCN